MEPSSGATLSAVSAGAGRVDRPIRVVVADDHALYRQSLRVVLGLDGDIEVVGEANNGHEAVRVAIEQAPDVVVVDVQMPRLGGVDAARAVLERTSSRILMLTMSEEHEDLLAALHAGVTGYLTKDTPGEVVADAIRRVHRDGIAISESAVAGLYGYLSSTNPAEFTNPDAADLIAQLSGILRRVATRSPAQRAAGQAGRDPELTDQVRRLLQAFRSTPRTPRGRRSR